MQEPQLKRAETIGRKEAAAILQCSDKFLDTHADELRKSGQGRTARYSLEAVLEEAEKRGLNISGPSIEQTRASYRRVDYYSSREVCARRATELGGEDASTVPLRFYSLPSSFRDSSRHWLFLKQEIDREIHIKKHGNLLQRSGLARFLNISSGTLKDAEARGELCVESKVGVKGFVQYSFEAVLKFVAWHYPSCFEKFINTLCEQHTLSEGSKREYGLLAQETAAMLSGKTHMNTEEMGKVLGLANPYSLNLIERQELCAVKHERSVYYPKASVWAEWVKRQIIASQVEDHSNCRFEDPQNARVYIALALMFEARVHLMEKLKASGGSWETVGVILFETNRAYLTESSDASKVLRDYQQRFGAALKNGSIDNVSIKCWADGLLKLTQLYANLSATEPELFNSLRVKILALQNVARYNS